MTIQELYDWCKENNAVNSVIDIGHDMPSIIKDLTDTEEEYNEFMDSMSITHSNIHVLNYDTDTPPKITLF